MHGDTLAPRHQTTERKKPGKVIKMQGSSPNGSGPCGADQEGHLLNVGDSSQEEHSVHSHVTKCGMPCVLETAGRAT